MKFTMANIGRTEQLPQLLPFLGEEKLCRRKAEYEGAQCIKLQDWTKIYVSLDTYTLDLLPLQRLYLGENLYREAFLEKKIEPRAPNSSDHYGDILFICERFDRKSGGAMEKAKKR